MIAALTAACIVLSFLPPLAVGLMSFFVGTLVYAVATPRIHNAINKRVGGERRSTILSTAGLMVHLLFIPSSIILGILSNQTHIGLGLAFIAFQTFLLGGFGFIVWARKDRTQKTTVQCP